MVTTLSGTQTYAYPAPTCCCPMMPLLRGHNIVLLHAAYMIGWLQTQRGLGFKYQSYSFERVTAGADKDVVIAPPL